MAITLNTKTKKSLQAGIDTLGMDEAKKRLSEGGVLSGLQEQAKTQKAEGTTGIKPVSPVSSPVVKDNIGGADKSGLEKATGYESSQVGIEGVNLFKKPPVIGGGTTDTTGAGIGPDSNMGGVEGGKGLPKIDDTITSGTQGEGTTGITGETGYEDRNKDGVIGADELSGDYKAFYDTLSDTEKKLFLATGENAMKNNLDIAETYANYMRDYETTKKRTQEDEAYRLQQQGISGEATDIQDSATLRRATASVDKLKQSIAYMGSMGMPGKSSQRVVSIENQVTEATKSLNELRKLQELAKSSRELGEIKSAQQYERQMEDITTKLNDDIDKSIQDAFNSFTAADNGGQLDTVEGLTAFRDKMYADLDMSITGFSDASISQMKFLVGEVDKARKEAVAYEQNANTVNSEMSAVKGYYVNSNGAPIYGADGATIKIPKSIPEGFEPFVNNGKFFSPKMDANGELILDENGSPIFNSTQLEDTVSVTAQLSNAYIDMVSKGVMSAEDAIKAVPGLATNEAFIKGVEKPTDEVDGNYKEDSKGRLYNSKTGKYLDDVGEKDSNISKEDAVIGQYTLADGTTITASKGTIDGLNKVMAINPDIQFDLNNLYRTQEDQYRLYGQGRTAEELTAEGIPAEYAQPELPQVSWTTKSSHMTGNAVDVVVPEGQDAQTYLSGVEEEMNKNGFFRPEGTMAKGDYGHFEYQGVVKEEKGIIGALGVPIAYERQIKQMVPTQLMNSEIELEALNDTIKRMGEAGIPVEDAVLTYLGFDITVDNKEKATEYVNVGKNLGEDLPTNYFATVSNHLAKGDLKAADKYVSNIVEDKVKTRYGEDAIMTASINQTMKDTRNLSNLIAKNPDKIGQFDGRVNDIMRKFKDYPEMTELNTLLTMTQAQTRKHFAGSAVTPSEMEALQDFIGGNTKMTPNNLLTMLNTIKDRTESQFLLQRKQFGYTPSLKGKEGNIIKDTAENDPLDLGIDTANNDPLGIN